MSDTFFSSSGTVGTATLAFSGPWAAQDQNIKWRREGPWVLLALPEVRGDVGLGDFISAAPLPEPLRPSVLKYGIYAAATALSSGAAARWTVSPAGIMNFYANGSQGNFTLLSQNAGILPCVIFYTI